MIDAIHECDKFLESVTGTVTPPRVTSHYTYTLVTMGSDPEQQWNSKKVQQLCGVKPVAARQILHRLCQARKIIKVGHGFYQYCAEKNGQLAALISRSGSVGIENLVYVTLGTRYPVLQPQNPTESGIKKTECDNLPTAKQGYPKHLPTGQEIRWELWANGSERLSFISNGNPFSLDLLIYLHTDLIGQGLNGDDWERVSIEVNKDTETITLTPECVTFQDTYGEVCKAYNHGKQARFEHADRRQGVTLADSLSMFLNNSDNRDGKTALKEVRELAILIEQFQKNGNKSDDRSRAAFSAVIRVQDDVEDMKKMLQAVLAGLQGGMKP